MKNGLVISLLSIGLIGGGIAMGYTNVDRASTQPSAKTATIATTQKAVKKAPASTTAKVKPTTSKAAASAAKPVAVSKARPAKAVKPTRQPTKATAAASQAQSAAPKASGLAAYYGTWHNAAVTITVTANALTVAQPGQPRITTTYQAVRNGSGYLFTPTSTEADALQLVLHNGELNWVTGASTPLVLVR